MESPTGVVFGGPGYGLADYTLGPMLVNELTMSLFIALAIMNILHVVRHTRAEEESGRAELLRSSVLGSSAQTSSALLTIALVDLIIGGLIFLSMIAYDLPVPDSLAYGLGLGLGGLAFAAVTAVCAQLAEHARTASGLAFLAIGVFFFVRVVGDMAEPGGTALPWFSPFSWTQQARPFVDRRRPRPRAGLRSPGARGGGDSRVEAGHCRVARRRPRRPRRRSPRHHGDLGSHGRGRRGCPLGAACLGSGEHRTGRTRPAQG